MDGGFPGSRAGQQESLWAGAGIEDTLPARGGKQVAVCSVGAFADDDAKGLLRAPCP
jgi:hypothetical protein